MIPGSSLQGPFTASRAHRRDVSACGRLAAGPRRPHEAGVHLHRAVNGRVARHSLSQTDIQKGWPVADWYSQSQNRDRIPRSRVNRSSFKSAVPSRERTHTDEARHGGRGARDRLRAGAAEGGGGGGGARAAEEARRREGGAPAPALHAAVLRRRQRRGDAEDPGRGGRWERGRGLGRRLRRRLPVLRVAGRLHRELPQEPGLRDHLRPPRHGGVRGGGGGGADDGQLAVQEAGRDGD